MQKSLMGLLSILILAGCATSPVVVPTMEKYCPRPVKPVIELKDVWTVQELLQMNLTVIDYSLKLEETVNCWEKK